MRRSGLTKYDIHLMVSEVKKQSNGLQKVFLIGLAYKTGLRLRELLNIKWSDFSVKDNQLILTVDQKQYEIESRVYNVLIENKFDEEKVFTLHLHSIPRMFERLRTAMNISPDTEFNFESIRKRKAVLSNI